jgi:hypothetical protein
MLSQGILTAGVVLVGPVLSLAALWLRLRFQLHGEHERHRYLLTAAMTLPVGSRIQEQRGDGTHLTLTVGDTQPDREPR